MKKQLLYLLVLSAVIQHHLIHVATPPNATTTINWNGITITNNVVDENILITDNNTLANPITVTAQTKNIAITIGSPQASINGNNYSLNFNVNNNCSISIYFENNILTLSNTITYAQPRVDLIFNNGINGRLILNSAKWLWK